MHTNQINRRKALTIAAAAPAAALCARTAFANGNDEKPRALWRRYIDVTKDYCAAARNEDQASSIINKEIAGLPRPWLPFPKEGRETFDLTGTRPGIVLTSSREVTVRRDGDDGAWLVLEFMPTHPTDMHLSNNGETRW
jgi:hypothetical protein